MVNAACEWLFIASALGNCHTCDTAVQSHLAPSQIQEAKGNTAVIQGDPVTEVEIQVLDIRY